MAVDYRTDLLNAVFDHVCGRLSERADSLCRFVERWHGSNGGIEGWFKVEFVAGVPKGLALVRTGSAATPGTSGNIFPDLRLETMGRPPVDVELKASTNWSLTHGKAIQRYDGWALFFLCGAPAHCLEAKRRDLAGRGRPFAVARVCGAVRCTDKKAIDFLFGFLDLGGHACGEVELAARDASAAFPDPEAMTDDRIGVDPSVCSGKPCIRGTRIMVKNVLGMTAGGATVADILDAYPELSKEDVAAAFEYASRVVDEEKVIPRA